MFTRFQKAALGLAMLAGLSVSSAAQAQTFTFAGTTAGCFGAGCSPVAGSTNDQGLLYTSSSFSGTTSNGFLGIGNDVSSSNNLGRFTIAGGSNTFAGNAFTLGVTFTLPVGTAPQTSAYSATVFGSVESDGTGGLFINFDNTPKSFTFAGGGAFIFFVNDVSLGANSTNNVSGTILAAPGPIAGAGIPAAVLGLVGFFHFRRRKSSAQV